MNKKMNEREFKKLLKAESPKKIIYMHTNGNINLTSKQLDKVIELKRELYETFRQN